MNTTSVTHILIPQKTRQVFVFINVAYPFTKAVNGLIKLDIAEAKLATIDKS